MIVDRNTESQRILEAVNQFNEPLVESLHLFSLFEGGPVAAGKKSVSFRITYRSDTETLQDDTINRLHKEISDHLIKGFDATLPT